MVADEAFAAIDEARSIQKPSYRQLCIGAFRADDFKPHRLCRQQSGDKRPDDSFGGVYHLFAALGRDQTYNTNAVILFQAVELGPFNIRVNSVEPGAIYTPMLTEGFKK